MRGLERAQEQPEGVRQIYSRKGTSESSRPPFGANFGQRAGQASQNPVEELQAGVVLPLPRKALKLVYVMSYSFDALFFAWYE